MAVNAVPIAEAADVAETETHRSTVTEWVLAELGTPRDLIRVEAKPLWDNYFRVNVYRSRDVGLNTRDVAVTDSFFVYQSPDGFLTNPPIEHKYGKI